MFTLTDSPAPPLLEVSHITSCTSVSTPSTRNNNDSGLNGRTNARLESQKEWKSCLLAVRFYINVE